jgi:hypothetical protein
MTGKNHGGKNLEEFSRPQAGKRAWCFEGSEKPVIWLGWVLDVEYIGPHLEGNC